MEDGLDVRRVYAEGDPSEVQVENGSGRKQLKPMWKEEDEGFGRQRSRGNCTNHGHIPSDVDPLSTPCSADWDDRHLSISVSILCFEKNRKQVKKYPSLPKVQPVSQEPRPAPLSPTH